MTKHEEVTQELRDAFDAVCKGRVEAAVLAEREACAKVCEDLHPGLATKRAAEIIRARGTT
jgi:hypothetical protein